MKKFRVMFYYIDAEPTINADRVKKTGDTEVTINDSIIINFDTDILTVIEIEPYHPEQDLFTGRN